ILVNFLLADCPRLRCIKLCLLSRESFADENLVRTVPQRASLIFEHCKISPERFTCSALLSVNFVLCIECCDGTSIYLSHKYGHGLLASIVFLTGCPTSRPQQHNLTHGLHVPRGLHISHFAMRVPPLRGSLD